MDIRRLAGCVLASLLALPMAAPQTTATPMAASASTAVPSLVPYSSVAIANDGKLLTGETGITFQIYQDQSGGEALWAETQTVAIDPTGHYKVHLGAENPNGLPSDLFATGEARWLEVQIAGQSPQPRELIASVPYALKAGDATTLGGLPASAFALAGKANAPPAISTAVTPAVVTDVTTTGGRSGCLSEFSGAATIVDSPVFALGADIGIGTSTPTATLDVVGTALISGALSTDSSAAFGGAVTIEAAGKATASTGESSHSLGLVASSYNSGAREAIPQTFELKAVPVGNDTSTASASLEVLFGQGTEAPAATGVSIRANGLVGIGTGTPAFQLESDQNQASGNYGALGAYGAYAATGSGLNGGYGVYGDGGGGDGHGYDGPGGEFYGGDSTDYGDGIDVFAGSGQAAYFYGNAEVTGTLYKSGGAFKIDHPLDPANKYLYHSFVESPDMMNIYNGKVTTDELGIATVTLPDWFESLNTDFRYQLTVIGGRFAQAIVSKEIENNHFTISTNASNVKVSWQVTGVRHDAWANAHRIPLEEEKNARERGHYIHPELYGAPEELSIESARHPQEMRRMKAMREAQKNKAKIVSSGATQSTSTLIPSQSGSPDSRPFIAQSKTDLNPVLGVTP